MYELYWYGLHGFKMIFDSDKLTSLYGFMLNDNSIKYAYTMIDGCWYTLEKTNHRINLTLTNDSGILCELNEAKRIRHG